MKISTISISDVNLMTHSKESRMIIQALEEAQSSSDKGGILVEFEDQSQMQRVSQAARNYFGSGVLSFKKVNYGEDDFKYIAYFNDRVTQHH